MNIKLLIFVLMISLTVALSACNSGASIATNSTAYPYQFVIDAGSSGSRIYVYSKIHTESGLLLADLYEKKTSTPLASYAINPEAAGTSITPLLESAIQYLNTSTLQVPNMLSVPTSLLGTAGMRLITESQQARIYANVAESISASGLLVGKIKTITGQYEGVYSWLDVNYLQNNLTSRSKTNGVFEVGGASAQVSFATTSALSSNDAAIIPVSANGQNYNVYSISFLGLGQDYARALMNTERSHNQCYPTGYTFSGYNAPYFSGVLQIIGDFNYDVCVKSYASVIDNYPLMNTVNRVGNFYSQSFIGVGSVYYALAFWGIESTPNLLARNIQTTCRESYNQIQAEFPNSFSLQNQCANSVLINNLLFNNLQFESNQISAITSIHNTSLTYTLGFALVNY